MTNGRLRQTVNDLMGCGPSAPSSFFRALARTCNMRAGKLNLAEHHAIRDRWHRVAQAAGDMALASAIADNEE